MSAVKIEEKGGVENRCLGSIVWKNLALRS